MMHTYTLSKVVTRFCLSRFFFNNNKFVGSLKFKRKRYIFVATRRGEEQRSLVRFFFPGKSGKEKLTTNLKEKNRFFHSTSFHISFLNLSQASLPRFLVFFWTDLRIGIEKKSNANGSREASFYLHWDSWIWQQKIPWRRWWWLLRRFRWSVVGEMPRLESLEIICFENPAYLLSHHVSAVVGDFSRLPELLLLQRRWLYRASCLQVRYSRRHCHKVWSWGIVSMCILQ